MTFLAIGLLSCADSVPPADAQSAVDTRFGAIEAFWAPEEAATLGIGWERILFHWNQLQPYGPADWNTLHVREEWLAEANAHGRTVVGLLKNTPDWATDSEPASGVPRGLYLPVDDPGNLWATFVRRVAVYYGPRGVHHWIIWNEPDIAPDVYGYEFGGTIQDYYQLLKVAYTVIKATDTSATIHLGGLTYWHDPGYLRRFLQLVVADPEAAANNFFFDVISLHIYFRPESIPLLVGTAYGIQAELGIVPAKPVWINETNARPSMDPEWPVQVQAFHIDLEQQAWYIVQAYALGFYSGASRIAVYKLLDIHMSPGDESWGLIRPYDFSKRPAFFAYQNTIKYLGGFTYPLQRERAEDYYIISLPRPQGLTRVLWTRTTKSVTLKVPALGEAAYLVDPMTDTRTPLVPIDGSYSIDLVGARCHVECLMGGPPVFLVEEGVETAQVPTAVPDAQATASNVPTPAGSETVVPTATAVTPTVAGTEATQTPIVSATPTVAPSATPTLTPSATATAEPTATATSTATATVTNTPPPPLPTETITSTRPPELAMAGVTAAPNEINEVKPESSRESAVAAYQRFILPLGLLAAFTALIWMMVLIRRTGRNT